MTIISICKKILTLFYWSVQVYVIGEEGILIELELAGFQHLGGPVSNNIHLYCSMLQF